MHRFILRGRSTRLNRLRLVTVAIGGMMAAAAVHAANAPPVISGTPPTSVTVNTAYDFRPSASDPDDSRRSLRFSIVNKPAWASFSQRSGRLRGVPTSEGSWSNIRISVTDGQASASLPTFAITAKAAGTSNSAPKISGTPPTTVRSGTAYSFTPSASDANGDALTFQIQNRPGWASFSTSNGRLSGTPSSAHVGTYSNVQISVSDGKASASLAPFAITVTDVGSGAATLSWTPPTQNTNGSALTNLAGYRIYYGTSSSALNQTIEVSGAGTASYVIGDLTPATWYFAVRAYNSAGVESANSNVASKLVM